MRYILFKNYGEHVHNPLWVLFLILFFFLHVFLDLYGSCVP
jgi:hypothetical protein